MADALPHLLPNGDGAIARWRGTEERSLPTSSEELLRLKPAPADPEPALNAQAGPLSGGLIWHNVGLRHEQSPGERCRNAWPPVS